LNEANRTDVERILDALLDVRYILSSNGLYHIFKVEDNEHVSYICRGTNPPNFNPQRVLMCSEDSLFVGGKKHQMCERCLNALKGSADRYGFQYREEVHKYKHQGKRCVAIHRWINRIEG
jgi:hypothetical protein